MGVHVGWAEFDALAVPIDARVGWAEFDVAASVATAAVTTRPSYSNQPVVKKKPRRSTDDAVEVYEFKVDMTDEDDEEAVILSILLEVCRYEFF